MKFLLPFPPSVNAAYQVSRGRRCKGVKVLLWEQQASHAINKQNVLPYTDRCTLVYELNHPDNRVRDAANYEKSTTDFLVAKGILQGDDRRHIKGVFSYWNDKPGKYITVSILPEDYFALHLF